GVTAPSRPPELKPTTPVTERLLRTFGVEDTEHDSMLSLPAAPPSPDLGVSLPDAEVSVRVNLASPERAAELARSAAEGPGAAEVGGALPPIVEPGSPVTPRRPLSYSALENYRRCGYRFYMERVLGLQPTRIGGGAAVGHDEGRAFGSAVHLLLEWSSTRRWIEPPVTLARRVLEAQGLDPKGDGERALALVRGWIESPLRGELGGADVRLRSEVPFLVDLGGAVLRGKLDLLAEPLDDPPTVVDYKTDRLDGSAPAELASRYGTQRDLYALAAAQATNAERVRVIYVFLERPDQPVVEELDATAITAARTGLEATVAELTAGHFEVTHSPDWGLCHDCPARRRLCSAPASPPGQ
ncbi:MAG TPA: PD-(D/E)XK nuclease family protein, partial [Solirubrobacterales bacterium]